MLAHASHAANERDIIMELLLHSERTLGVRKRAAHYVNRFREELEVRGTESREKRAGR